MLLAASERRKLITLGSSGYKTPDGPHRKKVSLMAEEPKVTDQPKVDQPAPAEAPKEPTPEPTVGEALAPKEPAKEPDTVPLATHLQVKKEKQALEKEIEGLRKAKDEGSPELSTDISKLADDYGVDEKVVKAIISASRTEALKGVDEMIEQKLGPIQTERKEEKLNQAFQTHFKAAMEQLPDEFGKVVNADVIKSLSLDPRNAKKTFKQLIEETYGNSIGGRKTIETTVPGGGKDPEKVDVERAKRDPEYFKEVMKDPAMKKQYNDSLETRIAI